MTALIKSFLPRFLFILVFLFFFASIGINLKSTSQKNSFICFFIPNMLRKTIPKQWPAQLQKKQGGHNCLCLKQVR